MNDVIIANTVIILALLFFVYTGYLSGFIRSILDLSAIFLSFFVSFTTYSKLAVYLEKLGLPHDFSDTIAFSMTWVIVEVLLYLLIQIFYQRIKESVRNSKANKFLGTLPAFVKGTIVLSGIILVFISLPFPNNLKETASKTFLGKVISKKADYLEKYVQDIFKETLKPIDFRLIKPESDEFIELGYSTEKVSVDIESEEKMLELINKEREELGLGPLIMDSKIQKVARKHSEDMFKKGYFSHKNKEGKTPFDRLDEGDILYLTAGENLALAPDVYIAHKGLMESPGHRENILTPEYKKIGIGVIDGGRYGKMFTQNFTD